MSRAVGAASAATALLTVHTALNLRRLRDPDCVDPDCVDPDCVGSPSDTGGKPTQSGFPQVSVLVPARDEASRIGRCVEALLGQRGVELELLVLDDESTDGTTAAAQAAAGGDGRLRVLAGRPLPSGWLGKPHACAQLAEAAAGQTLVFVDADVAVAPDGVAKTVALLRQAALDLASPYPRQLTESTPERLIQPLLQWSWLTFLPLGLAERLRAPALTAANGQLLACDAAAYRRAGGHAEVRAEVIEDVALARAFKRTGGRVGMADGTQLAACRMYEGWQQLRDGYTKSLWAAFGSTAGAVGVMALLSWLYVLPPAALVWGLLRRRPALAATGGAGYAAGVAGRVLTARRTGGNPADALAHPVSIVLLAVLTTRSLRHRARGQLQWKGRPVSS